VSRRNITHLSNLANSRGYDLSIITATLPGKERPQDSLARAYESLLAQEGDYRWEWLIQVDGGTEECKKTRARLRGILDDKRVKLQGNTRHLGQAITRNLALRRARGGATIYMDDDDELTENALQTWLEPLERNQKLGWSAGQLLDAKDNIFTQSRSLLPKGKLKEGELFKHWLSPERSFPHPPSCFAVRSSISRMIGGWQALPQGEDFGWIISSTFQAPGMVSKDPVYIYHKHEGNMMDRADFDTLESAVRNIVWDRAVEMSLFLESQNKNS
jgi:glycosyltransferase involved in cell wall biosynthesis